MTVLLFVHGYQSSSKSLKAQQTQQWLKENMPATAFCCPDLSPYPKAAIAQIKHVIELAGNQKIGLVGSSMGGFYATWLAEQYGLKAVLVNPVVKAHSLLTAYLGERHHSHVVGDFVLEAEHLDTFRSLDVEPVKKPDNFFVLLQTGDEVLDYALAENRYRECQLLIERGGDHGFRDYSKHLTAITDFLFDGE